MSDLTSTLRNHDRQKRPKLYENALGTSKIESREGCLWNQQVEARMTLVSHIDRANLGCSRVFAVDGHIYAGLACDQLHIAPTDVFHQGYAAPVVATRRGA